MPMNNLFPHFGVIDHPPPRPPAVVDALRHAPKYGTTRCLVVFFVYKHRPPPSRCRSKAWQASHLTTLSFAVGSDQIDDARDSIGEDREFVTRGVDSTVQLRNWIGCKKDVLDQRTGSVRGTPYTPRGPCRWHVTLRADLWGWRTPQRPRFGSSLNSTIVSCRTEVEILIDMLGVFIYEYLSLEEFLYAINAFLQHSDRKVNGRLMESS